MKVTGARAARAYERFLTEKNPKHSGKLPKNIQHQKSWKKNTNHLGTTSIKIT